MDKIFGDQTSGFCLFLGEKREDVCLGIGKDMVKRERKGGK